MIHILYALYGRSFSEIVLALLCSFQIGMRFKGHCILIRGSYREEIFKERQVFKTKVIENVQSELNQFGLKM